MQLQKILEFRILKCGEIILSMQRISKALGSLRCSATDLRLRYSHMQKAFLTMLATLMIFELCHKKNSDYSGLG